jgi:beta-N-acetylhexosaminidase
MKAVRDNGMLSCLKHFPGHGSAANDSHLGLTDVTKTWVSSELEPYRMLIKKNNIHSVMSSHIYNATIDSLYPASLSPNFIEKKLRKELNYNGVVISDDLQMGAISNYYSLEEIVIQSINAGNDILIFSQYFNPDIKLPEKVVQIIKDAVKSGKISEQRINESFERIIKLKKNLD